MITFTMIKMLYPILETWNKSPEQCLWLKKNRNTKIKEEVESKSTTEKKV
jgi:hypothetical protein